MKKRARENDFSTVWSEGKYCVLKQPDDAVYFYGGRKALYDALEKWEDYMISNEVPGLEIQEIYIYRSPVKVDGGKTKQIFMFTSYDKDRNDDLADFKDPNLRDIATDKAWMRNFRQKLERLSKEIED